MQKEAIAVFNPQDPWERAVQEASHEIDGEWLSSYECRLASRAISYLKCFDDWIDDKKLMNQRAKYFFAPHMSINKEQMVFVTHNLFLRDILENGEINAYLYSPITFVTRPIAYYLLREYPIHVHVESNLLKGENSDVNFIELGGLMIADYENVSVTSESILDIVQRSNNLQKAAVTEIDRGIFKIDEDERQIFPDDRILHKIDKSEGQISFIGPGEEGTVEIKMNDGSERAIGKLDFDSEYIIMAG